MTYPTNQIPSINPQNFAIATPVGLQRAARNPNAQDNTFVPGWEWQNTTTGTFYKCISSTIAGAVWTAFIPSTAGTVSTLTGNSGIPSATVGPDGFGDIKVLGDGTTITIVADPPNNKLTASLIGGGVASQSYVTNVAGPVVPTAAGVVNLNASTSTYTNGAVANTIKVELQGTNHALFVGRGALTPATTLSAATDGQIPIGSTGLDPVLATITAGSGITVTNGAGSITIAASSANTVNTLTGDSGGAISPAAGNINIYGNTVPAATGLTFAGAGSTLALGGTLVVGHGGTGATTLTGVIIGNGTSAFTGNPITQHDVLVGGVSNAITSVAPSATSGVPLVSTGAGSDPAFGTAVVAGGGTGDTSFTTYAPICGGTSATGALQQATTGFGTANFVLTSNGSAALPSWQAAPGSNGITTINMQVFTANGTYTPTTNMVFCEITCLGGGGAGGGAAANDGTHNSAGGGGGAGEYAVALFNAAAIGASKAVTIGSAGTGNSGTTGGNGGTSSVGTIITCGGGQGGTTANGTGAIAVVENSGGTGGTGGSTTGSINGYRTDGANGHSSYFFPSLQSTGTSGNGGNSQIGSGGQQHGPAVAGANESQNGRDAKGYGAGGGGAFSQSSAAAKSGGNGTAGIVIIREFVT